MYNINIALRTFCALLQGGLGGCLEGSWLSGWLAGCVCVCLQEVGERLLATETIRTPLARYQIGGHWFPCCLHYIRYFMCHSGFCWSVCGSVAVCGTVIYLARAQNLWLDFWRFFACGALRFIYFYSLSQPESPFAVAAADSFSRTFCAAISQQIFHTHYLSVVALCGIVITHRYFGESVYLKFYRAAFEFEFWFAWFCFGNHLE